MKELIGSEKQVKWANEIRAAYVRWFDLAMTELDEDIRDEDNDEEDIEELVAKKERIEAAFAGILDSQTSAAWWIDRRTTDPAIVAGSVYKPSYLNAISSLVRKSARFSR